MSFQPPPSPDDLLAGWGPRIGAWVIDQALLVLIALGIAVLEVVGWVIAGSEASDAPIGWAFVRGLAIALLIRPFLMARRGHANGQTIGKQIVGIRVVRMAGTPLGAGHVLLRSHVGRGLCSGLLPLIYAPADLIVGAASDRRRTVHDEIAGTIVLRAGIDPAAARLLAKHAAWPAAQRLQGSGAPTAPGQPPPAAPGQRSAPVRAQSPWPPAAQRSPYLGPPMPGAFPVAEVPWARRHVGWLIGGGVAVLIALVAGAVVLLASLDLSQVGSTSDELRDELRQEETVSSVEEVEPTDGADRQLEINHGEALVQLTDDDGMRMSYAIAPTADDATGLERDIRDAARDAGFDVDDVEPDDAPSGPDGPGQPS